MGDLETEHLWAIRVAEGSGAVVISVDYRRSPENPFPAAAEVSQRQVAALGAVLRRALAR